MQKNSIEINDVGFRFGVAEHVTIEQAKTNTESTDDDVSEGRAGDTGAEHGIDPVQVFAPSPSCPYIIPSEEKAYARGRDPYLWRNNVVVVENYKFERMGNHYATASNNLRVGFCCKSKLVSTPPLAFCTLLANCKWRCNELDHRTGGWKHG